MSHCMIDLETMGVGPDSLILSVGAVMFDPNDPAHEVLDRFHVAIEFASHYRLGGRVDPETWEWWMSPERDAARKRLHTMEKINIVSALDGFHEWYMPRGHDGAIPVWGNGAAFDNTILRSAYRHISTPCPWNFTHDRCYRTIKNLAPDVPLPPNLDHHDALADAMVQAFHLKDIVKHLELKL